MISGISDATRTPAVAHYTTMSTQMPTQLPAQSKLLFATSADSVQLSKAAQAGPSAVQETAESPAQTAKEASNGDLQAQRLQAREAAAKSVTN